VSNETPSFFLTRLSFSSSLPPPQLLVVAGHEEPHLPAFFSSEPSFLGPTSVGRHRLGTSVQDCLRHATTRGSREVCVACIEIHEQSFAEQCEAAEDLLRSSTWQQPEATLANVEPSMFRTRRTCMELSAANNPSPSFETEVVVRFSFFVAYNISELACLGDICDANSNDITRFGHV